MDEHAATPLPTSVAYGRRRDVSVTSSTNRRVHASFRREHTQRPLDDSTSLLVRGACGYSCYDFTHAYNKQHDVFVPSSTKMRTTCTVEERRTQLADLKSLLVRRTCGYSFFRLHFRVRQTGCRFLVTPWTHWEAHTPPPALRRKKTTSPRWRHDACWIDKQAATPSFTRTRVIVAFRHAPSTYWEAYTHATGIFKEEEKEEATCRKFTPRDVTWKDPE